MIKNAQSIVEINQSLTQNQIALQELLANLQAYRGQITRTIYDLPYEPFVLQYSNLLLVQRNLRNRVSYVTYSDTAATSYNTASFYTYDIHGNVDTLLLDYGQSMGAFANIMNKNANRFKKIAYNYDLISGKVNRVAYQHGWADRFYHRYSYDAENRLIKAETSTDSLRWEEDANYQYYLHGPLARTVLGHRQVQGIDYAYTLQGWLKGVNSTGLSAEQDMGGDGLSGGLNQYVAKDAYGFNLNYFTGDYSAINESKLPFPGHMAFIAPQEHRQLYNGNISSMAVHNRALDADNLAGGQLLLYNYRYDQLNRITGMDVYNGFDKINNHWQGLTQLDIFKERVAYDPNGNILKYLRHGHRTPYVMDSLSYHYYPGTNRLNHVTDQVAAATFGNGQNDVADIDNQNADNYHYDETGNLVKDLAEGIDKITWTVYGKISSIEKANGTTIRYSYDPSGNRISKLVQRSSGDKNYTWYARDAQGNVMATYTANGEGEDLAAYDLKLAERHIYGSSRLGILTEIVDVDNNNTGPEKPEGTFAFSYDRGFRQYELSNHLGNVLVTVSDKKFGIDSDDDEIIDYFEPEIITAVDYYPFGMLMPGRGGSLINGEWQESGPAVLADLFIDDRTGNQPSEYVALESIEFIDGFESGSSDEFVAYITTSGTGSGYEGEEGLYRYGFNGKENDNESKGVGNQIAFESRIYDPRLGKFFSADLLSSKYPQYTPYSVSGNSPVWLIDIMGNEPDRNQAGTIAQALNQWTKLENPSIDAILTYILKDKNAVRYIYTNKHGWIDLNHYFGTLKYGKLPMDLLEPASGSPYMQKRYFGEGANQSYYSYEDLPSNYFASLTKPLLITEIKTGENITINSNSTGMTLINQLENVFSEAGATEPENAPNWNQIPFKDHEERFRLPDIKGYKNSWISVGIPGAGGAVEISSPIFYSEDEKRELLKTGKYVPQNKTSKPYDLKDFPAAPSSIDKGSQLKGVTGH